MINTGISNLLIIFIIVVILVSGWYLWPLHNTGTDNKADNIQKTAVVEKEFKINNSSNTLGNSLNEDKNINLLIHLLPPHNSTARESTTPLWHLKQHEQFHMNGIFLHSILDENVNKIDKDFRHGIKKSNQEINNSLNDKNEKQPKHLLSHIKLVNASSLVPAPSSQEATAPATATEMTNSTRKASTLLEFVKVYEALRQTKSEELLLHRNKRYLLFPEGSSFQLVFDLIIPIVDYTNFAIMGITCAMAWELPSKAPSEIIEHFRTKLNDGTYSLSRRNDSIQRPLEYINGKRTEQEAMKEKKVWRENVAVQYFPQLSATTATATGHENFITNAPNPPLLHPSSSSYYTNDIQRQKIQQPPTTTTRFSYGQHRQQQQWHNHNYKMSNTNQRKSSHTNNHRETAVYRNDNELISQADKHLYYETHPSAIKDWQQKILQQPQQTNIRHSDAENYWNKDNWWKRNKNPIENHWQKNKIKWSTNSPMNYTTAMFSKRTSRKRKPLSKPLKHRIYPIFGKRRRRRSSINQRPYLHNGDVTETLDELHNREHLQTRQKLYGKIEKLYKTRGQNGTACVLRALCETSNQMHFSRHDKETPQTFVMELLRSIFALPTDILTKSSLHLDDHYVNAVLSANDATQSCREKYYDCQYSITS